MTQATIKRLTADDERLMGELLTVFADVFDEQDTYSSNRPRSSYQRNLLSQEHFIALAALVDGKVVGGLAAYVFQKFEQERREFYIYDLAVGCSHRRKGIATLLIDELKEIAAATGAWLMFVQAYQEDEPAISLYSKLGTREDIVHFEIPVAPSRKRE